MERSIFFAVCSLRQPYPLYTTVSGSTFNSQKIRCASSKAKGRSKPLAVSKPKLKAPIVAIHETKVPNISRPQPKAISKILPKRDSYRRSAVAAPASLPVFKNAGEQSIAEEHKSLSLQTSLGLDYEIPEFVLEPGDTQIYQLPNDRGILGYAIWGHKMRPSRNDIPIVAFPGSPGIRLDGYCLKKWAHAAGYTVICAERPGYGISTYEDGITVLDHARDVANLAKDLGYKQWYAYGTSGGGPYALAMAYNLPRTVLKGTGIMCGAAPTEASRAGQQIWLYYHNIVEVLLFPEYGARRAQVREQIRRLFETAPKSKNDEIAQAISKHRFHQGGKAFIRDLRRIDQDWGFKLEDIDSNRVTMYAGDLDTNTPIHGSRWMARRLHNVTFRPMEGYNHSSLQQKFQNILLQEMTEMGKLGK